MKSNATPRKSLNGLLKDERGEMGISTMIVFIAAVLVAAIAAAVLIDTGSRLQERSSRTGNEVTNQVSSNLLLIGAQGERTLPTGDVEILHFMVSLAPGSSDVDLSQLMVQIKGQDASLNFAYVDGPANATHFNTTKVRDEDASHTGVTPVMNAGDLVLINIDINQAGMPMKAREHMQVTLLPEVGVVYHADLSAPSSFGNDLIVQLR